LLLSFILFSIFVGAKLGNDIIYLWLEFFQAKQRGSLGISLDVIWFEPATNTTNDIEAAQRAQDFQLGWYL
jgi:hypothetical protein